MTWITTSGVAGGIWFLLALAGLIRPLTRGPAIRMMLCLILSSVVVDQVLKPVFERDRPPPVDLDRDRYLPSRPRSLSFPSGHTSHAVAAAVALARMWPSGRAAWWTLAALMGYSRIYVGHHFPSDVVGGALIGLLIALWVMGGRHPATYANTLPRPLPPGAVVRP